MPDARRRLASGAPLAVGLSRADTEKLQDDLVGLGLVPRIGPAPEGTPPLAASDKTPGRGLLIAAVAATVVVTAVALLARREAGAPGEPDAATSPSADAAPQPAAGDSGSAREESAEEAIAPALRLELWAQLRADPAGVQLVGWVRGRGGEDPDGPLTLVGSAAGLEVVNESFEKPAVQIQRRLGGQQGPLLIRTVPFRVAVERSRLDDARELVLQARWGEWRSAPLVVRLPGGG